MPIALRHNPQNERNGSLGKGVQGNRNSGYHAEEEFARLPELIQKAVSSPGQLREWALSENVDGTW